MPEPVGQAAAVQLGRIDAAYLDGAAERGQLYVLVDGCAVPGLPALGRAAGATCLYRGEAERTHGAQAPWLFPVGPGGRLTFVERLGTGDWGCFLVSAALPPRLVRHLRSLLEVRSPAGEKWLFRFWDPRVLPTFLRASGPVELNAFFGPVESFAVMGGEGNAFAAWRAPEIVAPPQRRAVGERLAITPAQLAALRGTAIADRLARTFSAPYQSRVTPARDAVLVRAPDGGVTRFGLGNGGLIDGVTSPSGRHWAIDAHEDGRMARMVTPSGSALTIAYDPAGRIAGAARDGVERFRATHDRDGRLTRVDFPDGTAAEVDHAWQGRAALGDPDGLVIRAWRDRIGRVERFAQDGAQLSAAQDGVGNVTRFDRDAAGRTSATRFADGGVERYDYDPAGHVARIVRASGETLDVACDDAGQPRRITAADGAVEEYERDDAGRLIAARNGEIELRWTYDDAGRLIEERQGDAVVRHLHDDSGPVGIVYPDGTMLRWQRDADGRIVAFTDWNGGVHRVDYAARDGGWRMTGPDGLSVATLQDPAGFPASVTATLGDDPLWRVDYAHDAEDRLTGRRDSRLGEIRFDYDAEGQVLGFAHSHRRGERYAYDGAGNRVQGPAGAATFDPCNRIVTDGATRFAHDARGAMTMRTGPDGEWRYRHDGFGRLVEARDAQGRVLAFGYDPLGRRIWKRATSMAGTTLTRFHYAGEQVIAETVERDGEAQAMRAYGYAPLSWTPVFLCDGGVVHRYHCDPLGTPVRLIATGGRIVWEADGDPFGRARVQVAEVAQPIRLPGHYADDEFGFALHYNRHRFYDPATGRYVSPDPIGVAGGLNLYQYVSNDPVNRADPLGLWWKSALKVVATVAVAVAAAAVVVALAPVTVPAALVVIGAGAAAGAAGMMMNEALNQEEFCLSCILKAGLIGAVAGAVAAVPFAFAPAALGVAGFAGLGAGSGFLGYGTEVLLGGREWNWGDAAIAVGLGAVTAGAGRYIAGRGARPATQAADDAVPPSSSVARAPAPSGYTPPRPPPPRPPAPPSVPARPATGPVRGPDGRFVRSGGPPPVHNRGTEYPSGYRAGVVDDVLDAHTIQSGPNKGKVLTADGKVVPRDHPDMTMEHNTPVVEHWNQGGYDMTRAQRNDFYNDRSNLSPMLRGDNSSGGGAMSAAGVRYRQDTGPNYR